MKIKNSKALKQHNQYAILTEIIDNQPISRSDLTKNLDVSHTTVSYLVKDLMKKGLIVETYSDSTGGRPPKLLHFKGENKYIISLSFEDKIIRFSIFNLNYKLVDKARITVLKDPFRKILNKLDNLTENKLQENNIKEEGWELVGLQYLIGLLITTLLASLYALLRLISEHFIIPLLDKIFKDDD